MEILKLLISGIVGFVLLVGVIILLVYIANLFPKIEINIPQYIKDIFAAIAGLILMLIVIFSIGVLVYDIFGWQLPAFLNGAF